MSNPAIVLMTDPSRCSLGDVHYLMQALREMQQMGEHAVPQAFCDHPAAAKDFIEAYAHAYPQLVLQDGGIPTPDHLQSLIASGQIGALGQPPELAPFGGQAPFGGPKTTEQSSSSGFPIVVLTLGSSQVLIDAMQQSPAMKDSIRLIDIAPEGADSLPVSIAEAVAHGGLDGDGGWEAEGTGHGAAGARRGRRRLDPGFGRPGARARSARPGGGGDRRRLGPARRRHTRRTPSRSPPPSSRRALPSPRRRCPPSRRPSLPPRTKPMGPAPLPSRCPSRRARLETAWRDAEPAAADEPSAESEGLEAEGVADDAPPENDAAKGVADDAPPKNDAPRMLPTKVPATTSRTRARPPGRASWTMTTTSTTRRWAI